MNWKDVGVVAAKAAPVLGAVLGGPVGAVAGAAGTLLASALGVEADPVTVLRKLADPQSETVLKELEVRRQESLLAWQKEQLNAELVNVTDARAREVALAKAGHGASYAGALVSLVVVVAAPGVVLSAVAICAIRWSWTWKRLFAVQPSISVFRRKLIASRAMARVPRRAPVR